METAMFARFFRRTSSLLLVGQFLLWGSPEKKSPGDSSCWYSASRVPFGMLWRLPREDG
jgi:hypothetical protein